jgi:sec-independent protein translocase protein TatB
MCGISGPELIIIVVVALVVLGPERIPELLRSLGKMMREVRKFTGDLSQVTREIQSTVSMEELRKQIRDELSVERDKIRRLTQEVEIDQIRERKKKKAEEAPAISLGKSESEPAAALAPSDLPTALPSSSVMGTLVEPPDLTRPTDATAMSPKVDVAPSPDPLERRADARVRASAVAGVDDMPEAELPPLPPIRRPRGVVEQGDPGTVVVSDGEST